MGDLRFEPLIPTALWLAIVTGGGALLALYAVRNPASVSRTRWQTVVVLMSVAFGLVLLLLLNPTWSRELPPPAGKPVLSILVDSSASMATPDTAGSQTRYVSAVQTAGNLVGALSDRFDVRVRGFDVSARADDVAHLASKTPIGTGTDLSAAINSCLNEEPPQGQAIVLLSDGIQNIGGNSSRVLESVRTARALASPIYTRVFGGDVKTIDLAIDVHSPQDVAVVGQKIPLSAHVSYVGLSAVRTVVTLLSDGKEIGRDEALLQPNGSTDAHFLISRDKVGVYPYELRVQPLPGETSLANNTASYVLRVVDEPIHVLVLEGKPYWDSKFFTRTLAADPVVALDSFVRLAPQRVIRRTISHRNATPGTQPTGAEENQVETWQLATEPAQVLGSLERLAGYQVIVLGRDAEAFLDDTAVANLQHWVSQQGGALVCYRGAPTSQVSQKLERLVPVRWGAASASRFRVKLTDPGRDLSWFSAADAAGGNDALPGLPSLASGAVVEKSKPLAVVLARSVEGDNSSPAAVVYQPYGAGRVVVVEGAGMWRWAFMPPQFQQQQEVYVSLWHSMMRWLTSGQGLAPGQSMSLRVDKVRFGADESATATLLVREESAASHVPKTVLWREGGTLKSFTPAPVGNEVGVYRVNFDVLPEGRYTARLDGTDGADPLTQIVFDVRRYDNEEINLEARPDLMARIASDSGGAVLTGDDANQVAEQFRNYISRLRPPRIERTTAWDRWWILGGVIGLWGLSWSVRRSGGLV